LNLKDGRVDRGKPKPSNVIGFFQNDSELFLNCLVRKHDFIRVLQSCFLVDDGGIWLAFKEGLELGLLGDHNFLFDDNGADGVLVEVVLYVCNNQNLTEKCNT